MQITQVRLPDGRVVRPEDWKTTPKYSTAEIGNSTQDILELFSYGIGDSVPGSVGPRQATRVDTNQEGSGGVVPENEELLLYGIHIEFFTVPSDVVQFFTNNEPGTPEPPEVSVRNMLRLQRDVNLQLSIGSSSKLFFDHPVGFFPAATGVRRGGGSFDTVINNALFPVTIAYNGSSSWRGARHMATPQAVGPGRLFSMAFVFPRGAVGRWGRLALGAFADDPLAFGADTNCRIRARVYARGYRRDPVA